MAGKVRGARAVRTGRRLDVKPRRKRILVVSGGDVTEPEYFEDILNEECSEVHFHHETADGNPDAIAKLAAKLKREDKKRSRSKKDGRSEPYHKVFAVVDVDKFTVNQFVDANRTCNSNGIGLVVSNPCFEVWLIDHRLVCPDTIVTAAEAHDKALQEKLVCGRNGKSVVAEFVSGCREMAKCNAQCHNTTGRKARRRQLNAFGAWAPYTDMPDLLASCGI